MASVKQAINPLSGVGVTATTPPNLKVYNRAPTSGDFRNINEGDFWIYKQDQGASDIYQLSSIFYSTTLKIMQGKWIKIGEADGAINSITGNLGGAILPDGDNNIFIVGDTSTGITITGDLVSNTLTVAYTAADEYTLQTMDATPDTIASFTLNDLSSVIIDGEIIGAQNDYTASLVATFSGGARRSGGGAILVGSPQINSSEDYAASPLIDIIVNANDLEVQVTGVAGTTINWKARIKIITQST